MCRNFKWPCGSKWYTSKLPYICNIHSSGRSVFAVCFYPQSSEVIIAKYREQKGKEPKITHCHQLHIKDLSRSKQCIVGNSPCKTWYQCHYLPTTIFWIIPTLHPDVTMCAREGYFRQVSCCSPSPERVWQWCSAPFIRAGCWSQRSRLQGYFPSC